MVSNTAAIYLGFSANIRKLRAALVQDQDEQRAQLAHQNCLKCVALFLIGVPNRAVALDLPQPGWWFGNGHAIVQACWWLVFINMSVLVLRVKNVIHTTSLAIIVLVCIYSFIASFFLVESFISKFWLALPNDDHREPVHTAGSSRHRVSNAYIISLKSKEYAAYYIAHVPTVVTVLRFRQAHELVVLYMFTCNAHVVELSWLGFIIKQICIKISLVQKNMMTCSHATQNGTTGR